MTRLPVPVRRRDRAVVAGVCGGIAERWGVDPTLVRIAAVLLTLSGGIGLVLYALGVALMPTSADAAPPIERFLPGASRWPMWLWVVIAIVGSLAVGGIVGPVLPFGIMPAIVLGVVWYFGYRRRQPTRGHFGQQLRGHSGPPLAEGSFHRQLGLPAFEDSKFGRAAAAWRARVAEARSGTGSGASWPSYPPATTNPELSDPPPAGATSAPAPYDTDYDYAAAIPLAAPRRPVRSDPAQRTTPAGRALRSIGLILAGVSLTVLGVLSALGVSVPAPVWVAAPTAAIGLALVVGAFLGRPRGLGVLGTVLVIATLAATAGQQAANPPLTETQIVHTASEPAPNTRAMEFGQLDIDLSQLSAGSAASYRYSVNMGEIRLRVPREGNVLVHYRASIGSVEAPGISESGVDLAGTRSFVTDASAPRTVIEVSVESGSLEIRR